MTNKLKQFFGVAVVMLISQLGYANEPAHFEVDDQAVAMCMVVTSGIYDIATEHQKGASKQKAQKQLDKNAQALSKRFSDKHFVDLVVSSWKKGLDIIYTLPVQDNDKDKEQFVSAVLDKAFVACLDDLGA